jgi:CHAD domain-containing protein
MSGLEYWKIDAQLSQADLEILLSSERQLKASPCSAFDLEVLDSVDWKLWNQARLLVRSGLELELWSPDRCLACVELNIGERFWWQLPKGQLAKELEALLGPRAFTPQYRLRFTKQAFSLLNDDLKTLTRFELIRPQDKDETYLQLQSLRGYKKEAKRFLSLLKTLPLQSTAPQTLHYLARQLDIETARPRPLALPYALSAKDAAEIAVAGLAENMILSAQAQEDGIIADIDTEFLHQYRVSLRKTRSLISLFKKSLPPERYTDLKSELKTLSANTNNLRDLDVFLLKGEEYRQLLPQELQQGLTQLFHRIGDRRVAAWERVIAELQSESYSDQVHRLRVTLRQQPTLAGKQERTLIRPLACKKILKQYAAIVSDGLEINDSTGDKTIHELRIECKKLRYLLEFFAPLFAAKQLKQPIKQLKKLQDNLGRVNDYSLQLSFLLELGKEPSIGLEQLASINGLTAALYNKKCAERRWVVAHISAFCAEDIQQQFKYLFNRQDRINKR